MTINYQIRILSDWHCGTGLDSGADADLLVIKDEHDLPFIPGKTIKGLLRDALSEVNTIKGVYGDQFNKLFGWEEKEIEEDQENKKDSKIVRTHPGKAFFSNAELSEEDKGGIISKNLQAFLYRNYASTAIGENGIAEEHSLRTIQVCRPVTLEGKIHNVPDEKCKKVLELAMKWCRYLGSGRNRGLGRCKFEVMTENVEI